MRHGEVSNCSLPVDSEYRFYGVGSYHAKDVCQHVYVVCDIEVRCSMLCVLKVRAGQVDWCETREIQWWDCLRKRDVDFVYCILRQAYECSLRKPGKYMITVIL